MSLIARLLSRTIRHQAARMRHHKRIAAIFEDIGNSRAQTIKGLREEIAKKDKRISILKDEKTMLAQRIDTLNREHSGGAQ